MPVSQNRTVFSIQNIAWITLSTATKMDVNYLVLTFTDTIYQKFDGKIFSEYDLLRKESANIYDILFIVQLIQGLRPLKEELSSSFVIRGK